MKGCLSFIGIIFLVIVIAGAAMFGYAAYMGSKLDPSSKKYVDESIPLIVGTWDQGELQKRASPEFKKAVTDAELSLLFSEFKSKLGPMVKYKGAAGSSNISYTSQDGKIISASYKVDAEFQRGTAVIDCKLIQHNGAWQILGLHVNLPLDTK